MFVPQRSGIDLFRATHKTHHVQRIREHVVEERMLRQDPNERVSSKHRLGEKEGGEKDKRTRSSSFADGLFSGSRWKHNS